MVVSGLFLVGVALLGPSVSQVYTQEQQETRKEQYVIIKNITVKETDDQKAVIATYTTNLDSEGTIRFYLLNAVGNELIERKKQSASKTQVKFGAFQSLWPSTYFVKAVVKPADNRNIELQPEKFQLISKKRFLYGEHSQSVFEKSSKFKAHYREVIVSIYHLYLEVYSKLGPYVRNRPSSNSPEFSRFKKDTKKLKEKIPQQIKQLRKKLQEMGDPTAIGYPFRSRHELVKAVVSTAKRYFQVLFQELEQEVAAGKPTKKMDREQISRRIRNGKASAGTLRKYHFLPQLAMAMKHIDHPFRKRIFQISMKFMEPVDRFLVYFLRKVRGEEVSGKKLEIQWNKLRKKIQKLSDHYQPVLDRHLGLVRNRANRLTESEQYLRQQALFLKRFPVSLEGLKKTIKPLFQSSPSLTGEKQKEALASFLKVIFPLHQLVGREIYHRFDLYYERLDRAVEVVLRKFQSNSNQQSVSSRYVFTYLDDWKEEWDQLNQVLDTDNDPEETIEKFRGQRKNKQQKKEIFDRLHLFLFTRLPLIQKKRAFAERIDTLFDRVLELKSKKGKKREKKQQQIHQLRQQLQRLLEKLRHLTGSE